MKDEIRKHTIQRIVITALEIAAIVAVVWLVIYFCQGLGIADGVKGNCWVMCSTTGSVNVRQRATTNSPVIGWYEAGDRLTTDWEVRGEWLHVVDLSLEYTEGWISSRYMVFDEPQWMGAEDARVEADGRVAIRQYIDGPRVTGKAGWAKPDSVLQVFWWSREWSYTNRGFIRSEYLEVIP
jgi:hypothetical protein